VCLSELADSDKVRELPNCGVRACVPCWVRRRLAARQDDVPALPGRGALRSMERPPCGGLALMWSGDATMFLIQEESCFLGTDCLPILFLPAPDILLSFNSI
jgi:hypothetical protein